MTMKSINGGYKILDFALCPITSGLQTAYLPNVYSFIGKNNNKPILVNNLVIDNVLQQPLYINFRLSSGTYVADIGLDTQLNVTSSNNVYVSTTPAPEPPSPTPTFEPNVLDLSEVGETIWSTITEVTDSYDTVSEGSVVLRGVAAHSGPAAPLLPDFTGQFFRYFTGSKELLCLQMLTGWDETNNVPYFKYLCVSEDDKVGILSSPEDYVSN